MKIGAALAKKGVPELDRSSDGCLSSNPVQALTAVVQAHLQ